MADQCCYSNDGRSMRWVPEDYKPEAGEKVYADARTPEQLKKAFPGRAAAASRDGAAARIAELEAGQTPRRLREAATTAEGRAWLEALDAEIAALRQG